MGEVEKEHIRNILKSMLFYYYENMGLMSEIGDCRITPKLVAKVTERYLELGGRLPSEQYEIYWSEKHKV